jgi:hypothetical protein
MRLTPAHDAILRHSTGWPQYVTADTALVAALLEVPEAAAVRWLDEMESAGYLTSATGPVQ